jgi:predicted transcriptional regulator
MNNNVTNPLESMHRTIARPRSRCWTEISAAILYSARDGPVTRTKIMYRAFLSYEQIQCYISDLMTGELIEPIDESQRLFSTTSKGYEFLRVYEKVQELIPVNRRVNLRTNTLLQPGGNL